ncbi:MAG: FAD-binding oxidoreductase, partial [Armatimonadota bacterium]
TKNAAGLFAADGMDLVDLFVGSEGILGVVTRVLVRLTERPELVSDTAFFDGEDAAVAHADALREAAAEGVAIVSIEYYDPGALRFMADQPQVKPEHQAAIFTEVAAEDFDAIEALAMIIEQSAPLDDWFADSERDREAQRTFRHALPENVNTWLRQHGTDKLCTDYAVPAAAFGRMMDAYREATERFLAVTGRPASSSVVFGHIGNYHLHVDFLPADAAEEGAAMEQYIFLARTAIDLGGTITAEHGVGKKTLPIDGRDVPYLELMYGVEGLEEIAAAKRALDPASVLNLGNMIPAEMVRSG